MVEDPMDYFMEVAMKIKKIIMRKVTARIKGEIIWNSYMIWIIGIKEEDEEEEEEGKDPEEEVFL